MAQVQELPLKDREWLSIDDAVLISTLSKSLIRREIAAKNLPAYRRGGRVLIRRAELDAWLSEKVA